ncbi:MAG: isocitrate lyase/phosphoenolpyruvate mutase family protein [Rhodanobacteraceae bacterium]
MHAGNQTAKAHAFRKLHDRSDVLILPNAWDAASARLLEAAGFPAIATTSGGVAWSLGYADGELAPFDELVAAATRITRAVGVPVTVDMESGYGELPEAVAESVRRMIDAGAVGINLEDSMRSRRGLRDLDDAAARLQAARNSAIGAGVPIVINARVDTYLIGFGSSEDERLAETIRRAQAYLAAGADCIYPIGLGEPATLEALIAELDVPINVAARPGMPGVAELARMGVARVSTATRLPAVAYSAADRAARQLLANGSFEGLDPPLKHDDLQRLFDAG